MKFEEKLKAAHLAMTVDGLVSRVASADEFQKNI